jgi:hypothetical protein
MCELKEENARLKKMYAKLSLAYHALKDAVEKSSRACTAARAEPLLVQVHWLSSTYTYLPRALADGALIKALNELWLPRSIRPSAAACATTICAICHHGWNHKRLPLRVKQPLLQPQAPKQV